MKILLSFLVSPLFDSSLETSATFLDKESETHSLSQQLGKWVGGFSEQCHEYIIGDVRDSIASYELFVP
jgi:hypothetical protein